MALLGCVTRGGSRMSTPLNLEPGSPKVEWPSGWRAIDGDEAVGLLRRLRFEAPPSHPLSQTRLQAVARSQGTDDVVYKVLDEADRFVVVHLTWSSEPETNPEFPGVEFDGPFDRFVAAQPSFETP